MNDEGIGIGLSEQESGDAIMCTGFFYLSLLQKGGTGFMYTLSGLPDIEKRAFYGVLMRSRCVKLFLSNKTTS